MDYIKFLAITKCTCSRITSTYSTTENYHRWQLHTLFHSVDFGKFIHFPNSEPESSLVSSFVFCFMGPCGHLEDLPISDCQQPYHIVFSFFSIKSVFKRKPHFIHLGQPDKSARWMRVYETHKCTTSRKYFHRGNRFRWRREWTHGYHQMWWMRANIWHVYDACIKTLTTL